MAIDLVTQYLPYVDELFSAESKKSLLTNQDLSWTGAHTIKVYKVTTASMNDYGRSGPKSGDWSRYGKVQGLDATTEEFTLKNDRSFTFAIDKLDRDETSDQLAAASALARQVREVVIPEVDTYVYGVMTAEAGHKPAAVALTADNIYTEVIKASKVLLLIWMERWLLKYRLRGCQRGLALCWLILWQQWLPQNWRTIKPIKIRREFPVNW